MGVVMLPLGRKRGDEDSAGGGPRMNVVAIVMLLTSIAIGIGGTVATSNPLPVIVGVVVGLSPTISRGGSAGSC